MRTRIDKLFGRLRQKAEDALGISVVFFVGISVAILYLITRPTFWLMVIALCFMIYLAR